MATAAMPSAWRAKKFRLHRIKVQRTLDGAVGANALVDLDNALVEHVRLDDVARENLRPRLIADAQRVAKTLGDEKERAVTLAFKERIGGDRGPHLHGANVRGRDRLAGLKPEQVANTRHRRVGIGFGIFRKELMRNEFAVRAPADHVGKGAAAVDPELPASGRLIHGL